jgi:hypothetical protein
MSTSAQLGTPAVQLSVCLRPFDLVHSARTQQRQATKSLSKTGGSFKLFAGIIQFSKEAERKAKRNWESVKNSGDNQHWIGYAVSGGSQRLRF